MVCQRSGWSSWTATHCSTLQHTATHRNTLKHTAKHCNTLQHTATHYNTLQHTATHCNTLQKRACLSIFIYGETNKKFRAYGQTVYEETSKIKRKTLSLNQRQGNQIAYYTKTPRWISSKLTPADASRSCASFWIWSLHCADVKRNATAVSLPSTANLFLITKQPRDKNSELCQQILLGFRNERVTDHFDRCFD